ncbi:MAG: prepilin-type N-terminal cleavage/methylation domain-containing protein [Nitrospinae bacterium]|nr:prepilin-type N-terminal cleavage/methylation domain-containing protein [Nitrospinota bacterium]
MHCRRLRNENGFSIIEIISVILVLGVVAAVVYPSFNISGVGSSTGATIVETDIRFVQELAMSRNPSTVGEIGITFTAGQSSYTLTDPAGMYTQTRDLPDSTTITQGGTVSFNKYGEPEIAGSSIDIKISDGGTIKTITVEQYTGRTTIS